MEENDSLGFNSKNYPKAETERNYYRLSKFTKNKDSEESKAIENKLWNYILRRANERKVITEYLGYQYIDSGWEWSVFRYTEDNVIKIPAGLFPEVNTKEYFNNLKKSYQLILKYFKEKFVAATEFQYPHIYQRFIKGKGNFIIGYNTKNTELLVNLSEFLDCAISMLKEEEWLPDFDIKRQKGGFKLNKVIIDESTFIPKIIDFSAYYDIYRMYPERTLLEIINKSARIKDLRQWVKQRVISSPNHH